MPPPLHNGDVRRVLLVGLVLLTVLGCDRKPIAPPPPRPKRGLEIRSLAGLPANQPTQIASLDPGRAIVLQPGVGNGQPRIVSTSGAEAYPAVLEPGAVGAARDIPLLSMVTLPSRSVVFFALDGKEGRPILVVGNLEQKRFALRVLIDANTLERDAGLGPSIGIAHGQLAMAGREVWLMLTTPDEVSLLKFDLREVRADASPRLTRPFGRLRDENGRAFHVEATDVLSGNADGSLTLFRPATRELWPIDADGKLHIPPVSIEQRPPLVWIDTQTASTPANRHIEFFPEEVDGPPVVENLAARYPLLIVRQGSESITFDRDAMTIRAGFPTHALRITAWCADASGDLIAYDAMSGEVFRVRFIGL